MAISRRHLLGFALAAAWPGVVAARIAPLYLAARRDETGQHRLAAFDVFGRARFDIAIPERAHGLAVHPAGTLAVLFARRPGRRAWVVDLAAGRIVREIAAIPGRHFYGHGAFDAAGQRLFATENDYDAGRGVIGVYDTGFRRVDEWDSGGIGPHEIRRLSDGDLVVANGGILTHPDLPRTKLNLPTMAPNLTYLAAGDGRVLETARLAPARHLLSIRHLSRRGDDTIVVALQHEGPADAEVPLLALHRRGEALRPMQMPTGLAPAMRGYVGSVAFDVSGTYVAATAPRGNLLGIWEAERGVHLKTVPMDDVCGLAALPGIGRFLATSGTGSMADVDIRATRTRAVHATILGACHWDNHVALVPA